MAGFPPEMLLQVMGGKLGSGPGPHHLEGPRGPKWLVSCAGPLTHTHTLLPGRQCIQPEPALQGVGRVSPKCKGGSWPAALKSPLMLQGGRVLGVGVPSVQKHLRPGQRMFSLSLPRSP